VDLRVCRKNCAPQTCRDKRRNGKYRFQTFVVDITALRSTTMPSRLVKRCGKRLCNNQVIFCSWTPYCPQATAKAGGLPLEVPRSTTEAESYRGSLPMVARL